MKKIYLLIGLIIVILILVFFLKNKTKLDNNINEKMIVDCYNQNFTEITCSLEETISFLNNFEKNFKSCTPSTGTFAYGLEPALGLFRGYKIVGEKDEVCNVIFWFLDTNITPFNLLDTNMNCYFNDSQRELDNIDNLNFCQGLLVDEINSLLKDDDSKLEVDFDEGLYLDIITPKNTYFVGETLEGSEYYLEYKGDPFQVLILYSESTEGLKRKSYSASRGTLKTGNFKDGSDLSMLKHSMYSYSSSTFENINPFVCDGNYVYTISVYDCKDVDDFFKTDDCGSGGWPPTIKLEDVFLNVVALESFSKKIEVVCPEGVVDCCEGLVYACTRDEQCVDGYFCKNNRCFLR